MTATAMTATAMAAAAAAAATTKFERCTRCVIFGGHNINIHGI
jgi:hypothetical protein